jgi:hypothetical protein
MSFVVFAYSQGDGVRPSHGLRLDEFADSVVARVSCEL